MTETGSLRILAASDGAPVTTDNPRGSSAVLLICEHASQYIPASLNNLGLDDSTANSHVAWDPGALAVAKLLSTTLNACLIYANISRLVYDCNRPPDAPGAMQVKSEIFPIEGNRNLSDAAKEARISEIYLPFTKAVETQITARSKAGRPTAIVTIHSFTPIYFGETRKVELGLLHDKDSRLADAMLALPSSMNVRRNQPYGPQDGVTHTLQVHALKNGALNVMVEIRNDFITTEEDQVTVANELAQMIVGALKNLGVPAKNAEGLSNA
ncbi:MAG: N-formylglutamate amidohydrolase [Paracoccaceae bacterium]